ncbi:cyclopropane-fatty-acyl-phospholipid synthase family protein [Candidatus Uabimicrobium sp. HlEnr_7]|uniref:SAM-dependent methyltransferase n=1 Tax=Candidatus Uabimicrobium helgolandensis TaxID=3095367 RepID=UPI00355641A7
MTDASYHGLMEKAYAVELDEFDTFAEIPFRHFGYFPTEESIDDVHCGQIRYVEEMTKYLKKGSYVLDLGCAFGKTSIWLAQNLDCRVLGIDIVDVQIQQAKKYAKKFGVEDRVQFQTLDAVDMDFHEEFDYILSLGVLFHVPDKTKVFSKIYKALKPGGMIAYSDPFINKNCSLVSKTMANWMTFDVRHTKTLEEHHAFLKEANFLDIESVDVTEISFIRMFEYSKKENFKTFIAPFKQQSSFWTSPLMMSIVANVIVRGLKKRHWGWNFFWARKEQK